MEYYSGQCKACSEDCDDEFCSDECMREWNDGYTEELYSRYEDSQWEANCETV